MALFVHILRTRSALVILQLYHRVARDGKRIETSEMVIMHCYSVLSSQMLPTSLLMETYGTYLRAWAVLQGDVS